MLYFVLCKYNNSRATLHFCACRTIVCQVPDSCPSPYKRKSDVRQNCLFFAILQSRASGSPDICSKLR